MNDLKNKVESVLDSVRPFLQADKGDIELIEITNKHDVLLKLFGNCRHCGMRNMTMRSVVEDYLRKEIPALKTSSIVFFNSDMIMSVSSATIF